MKLIVQIVLIVSCLAAGVISASIAPKDLKKQEPDFFGQWFQNVEIYERVISAIIISALTEDPQDLVDPIPFKNFTFDHTGFMRDGTSNMYNPKMSGLSKMHRVLTINNDTKEVTMEIKVPQVNFTGTYDMYVINHQLCIPGFGCGSPSKTWEGKGNYNHIVSNISFNFNFTLADENNRIRDNFVSSVLNFEKIELSAENYTIDGNLQTNWEQISEDFKTKFDAEYEEANRFVVEESVAFGLNLMWGYSGFTMDTAVEFINEFAKNISPIKSS